MKPARAELHSKIIDKEKEIVKGGRGETNGGEGEKETPRERNGPSKLPKHCTVNVTRYTVVVETAKVPTLQLPYASGPELSALRI